MEAELSQNFARIIRTLEGHEMKPTKIANLIGYTTTTQLYNTMEGKSLVSTKAVLGLIENFNINPIYLFLGKSDMFLPEEDEIEKLRRENSEWVQRHNEALKTIMVLNETIKTLEKRNADLIDITSAAKEYYKFQLNELHKDNEDIKAGSRTIISAQEYDIPKINESSKSNIDIQTGTTYIEAKEYNKSKLTELSKSNFNIEKDITKINELE